MPAAAHVRAELRSSQPAAPSTSSRLVSLYSFHLKRRVKQCPASLNQESNGISWLELPDRGLQCVSAKNGIPVNLVDHIAGLQPDVYSAGILHSGRHDDSRRSAQVAKRRCDSLVDRDAQDA